GGGGRGGGAPAPPAAGGGGWARGPPGRGGPAAARRVAGVRGGVEVWVRGGLAGPGVVVRPRRDDLLRTGVAADAIGRAVRSLLGGFPIGHLVDGAQRVDVVVRVDASRDPDRLAGLPVAAAAGRPPAPRHRAAP